MVTTINIKIYFFTANFACLIGEVADAVILLVVRIHCIVFCSEEFDGRLLGRVVGEATDAAFDALQ